MKGGAPRRSELARYRLFSAFLTFLLLAVGARLVWLQAVASASLSERARDQRTQDLKLSPRRGVIYDREGEPLAVSIEAKTVYANPHSITDTAAAAAALARCLGKDQAYYAKLLSRDSGFVYIERKVPIDRVRPLMDAKIPGIGFSEDSRRAYPCGDLASQVLGFVGVDDEGLAGIELMYDKVLAGTPGRMIAERDPLGWPIPGGVKKVEKPVDGDDVMLSIDKDIQYHAQLELAEAVERYQAKSGSVIVMDPNSGEILALCAAPSFNPNDFKAAEAGSQRNRPVTDVYEPGSTIKSFTAAAVIDKGLYEADSKFVLPPTLKVGDRTIHESHGRGTVTWTLTDIVTKSSNVGAVKLGQALGPKTLYEYFGKFGLLEKTGVDFPGEAKGWMPAPKQWSASTIGNVPFGQGVSVTPLQLARALSVIANGGELVKPHLLLTIPDKAGGTFASEKRRVVPETTAAKMTDIMTKVVGEGTGEAAAVKGYHVAGKTGTAQKAKTDGRGYAPGKYVASFGGFLPAEDPRVLILVTIDEPRGAIYGGAVAAPVFSRIGAFAVSHLKIPPPATPATASAAATGTR